MQRTMLYLPFPQLETHLGNVWEMVLHWKQKRQKLEFTVLGTVVILLLPECICFICEIQHIFLIRLYGAKKERMPFL